MLKVAQIDGIEDVCATFSSSDEVHVILDAATSDALLPGLSQRDDEFAATEFDDFHAWQNRLGEKSGGEFGIDFDAQFAASKCGEGFQKRMSINAVPALQQQSQTL